MTAFSGPERAEKQVKMALFEVQYEHLPGGSEYNHAKPASV
jgi:hypothetical protein